MRENINAFCGDDLLKVIFGKFAFEIVEMLLNQHIIHVRSKPDYGFNHNFIVTYEMTSFLNYAEQRIHISMKGVMPFFLDGLDIKSGFFSHKGQRPYQRSFSDFSLQIQGQQNDVVQKVVTTHDELGWLLLEKIIKKVKKEIYRKLIGKHYNTLREL